MDAGSEDSGTCGICGVDPVAHEAVNIGLTEVGMCEDCYEAFLDLNAPVADTSNASREA